MKKSQSFRQDLACAELGSSPAPPLSPSPQEFPSLPVQPLRPDVILKKNKSMSSALSIEASHQRFRSSIENWSFANEGLKKSIGSLAEVAGVPTTQSSESLKTISSLLEEPDPARSRPKLRDSFLAGAELNSAPPWKNMIKC